MNPPSFNGLYIFGAVLSFIGPSVRPTEFQGTALPGLDGVVEKRMGERGGYTTIQGLLYSSTVAGLASAIGTIRGSTRWGYCDLIDIWGQDWPKVRCETFEEEGRVSYDPGGLGYSRHYKAVFFHPYLTPP